MSTGARRGGDDGEAAPVGRVEKHKICMVGATGVGKTSLVARFVRSIFSPVYQTTVGVTIEKARVLKPDRAVDLVIWDLSGEDEFQSVQQSYLRGAAGYLLVADGTRKETVTTAFALQEAATARLGRELPVVLVLNKADLADAWDLDAEAEAGLERGWPVIKTSAKTGSAVSGAFGALVDAILAARAALHGGPR